MWEGLVESFEGIGVVACDERIGVAPTAVEVCENEGGECGDELGSPEADEPQVEVGSVGGDGEEADESCAEQDDEDCGAYDGVDCHSGGMLEGFLNGIVEVAAYFAEAAAGFVGVGDRDEDADVEIVPAGEGVGLGDEFFVEVGHWVVDYIRVIAMALRFVLGCFRRVIVRIAASEFVSSTEDIRLRVSHASISSRLK